MGVSSQYVASSASIADGAVTHAKLATAAVAVDKMANEGTSTQVLTSNGPGSPPSYQNAGAVTGTWSLVGEYTLSGNAATVSSLSGQYLYMIVFSNFLASDNTVLMEINGDSTANHYVYQEFYYANTTASGGRSATQRIFTAATATNTAAGICYLWRDRGSGYAQASHQGLDLNSGAFQIKEYRWAKTDATITEITAIKVYGASTCTGKFSLFKISLV